MLGRAKSNPDENCMWGGDLIFTNVASLIMLTILN